MLKALNMLPALSRSGFPPFSTTRPDGSVTFQNIIHTRYAVPFNKDCPAEARDLVLRLLQPDKAYVATGRAAGCVPAEEGITVCILLRYISLFPSNM